MALGEDGEEEGEEGGRGGSEPRGDSWEGRLEEVLDGAVSLQVSGRLSEPWEKKAVLLRMNVALQSLCFSISCPIPPVSSSPTLTPDIVSGVRLICISG